MGKPQDVFKANQLNKSKERKITAGIKNEKDEEIDLDEDPVKKGHFDAIKDTVKDKEKAKKKFEDLVQRTTKILFEVKSTFPFDLFPDKLTIDVNKVNINLKEFFGTGRVHSVSIKDISDVFVDSGPIFSTLKIIDAGFIENTINVRHLKKKEALKARSIIQGLIVAQKQEIPLDAIEDLPDLIEKLEKLGSEVKQE